MAINIFAVDEDNAAKVDYGDDPIVGRFRAGYQVNKLPVSLSAWRVTTGDPEVAGAVADLLGAEEAPSEWETSTEETLQVFTEASAVDVIIEGKGAVKATLVLWGAQSKILETDGSYLYDDDGNITDEKCDMTYGKTLKELKAMARAKKGPAPSLQVYFKLADAPQLGKFRFYSGSWTALEEFDAVAGFVAEAEGPQLYSLAMERNEFTNADGELIKYSKPRLIHKGAA